MHNNRILEEKMSQIIAETEDIIIDQSRMQATLDTLHQYMPQAPKPMPSIHKLPLVKRLKLGFMNVSPSYWLVSMIIYMVSFLLTLKLYNPYTLMFLSPLPFLIMFYQDIRGRDLHLLEMELACPYSPQEIIIARMVVTISYNFIVMTLLSILLYGMNPSGEYFNLLITWITPFIIIGNLTLMVLRHIRNTYTISSMILIWFSLVLWFVNTPQALTVLYTINLTIYIAMWIGGMLLLITQLIRYMNESTERSAIIGN